jgi:hypothetical protein
MQDTSGVGRFNRLMQFFVEHVYGRFKIKFFSWSSVDFLLEFPYKTGIF